MGDYRSWRKPTSRVARRGFVLIATCIALMLLLAFAVLSVDIGRMLMIKSELQAFTDAAALNAALQLDGSAQGLVHARAAAEQLASGPNAMKWDMGTQPITGITTTFAKGGASPDPKSWKTKPDDAGGYRFVRVNASAPAPVIFIHVFSPADSPVIAVTSVARKNPNDARLVQ